VKLTVNGDTQEHSGDGTLVSLLKEMGIDGRRVAVVVNDEVVSRGKYGSLQLREGDRVELLTLAAGG